MHRLDPRLLQPAILGIGFDALRDNVQTQPPRQLDNRGQHADVIGQHIDKDFIDFQDVYRQRFNMLQLAQAGVAHTKVIEGNPHARFTQRTQQGNNRLRVVYPTAFGDFQYQRARRDTIARQQRQHLLAAIVMQQLQQRHVDRQRQHDPLILPAASCRQASSITQ